MKGSITLEAAMILPFFLLFVVFLATLIRISIAEIGLEESVSSTTQTIATHAYPATYVTETPASIIDDRIKGATMDLISLENVEKWSGKSLSDFGVGETGLNVIEQLSQGAIESSVQENFRENVPGSFFNPDDIKATVELPADIKGMVSITAEYKLDIVLPFVDRTIILKKRATERLWTGG